MGSVIAVTTSFVIFIIIACRLGHRKLLIALDHKITCIRQNLNNAVLNKEAAIEDLKQERSRCEQIANEIDLTLKQAESKALSVRNQILQDLDLAMVQKNHEIKQTIHQLHQKYTQTLQEETANLTLETFKMLFETKFSTDQHEMLNDNSIKKIIDHLRNRSH